MKTIVITLSSIFLFAFSCEGDKKENQQLNDLENEAVELTEQAVLNAEDFKGKIDGKEFDGGSSSDYVLEVGSGTFIDGFEDQLIGHKTKDNFKISVVFPEDYGVDSLNGKEAVFQTSIQKIYKEAK